MQIELNEENKKLFEKKLEEAELLGYKNIYEIIADGKLDEYDSILSDIRKKQAIENLNNRYPEHILEKEWIARNQYMPSFEDIQVLGYISNKWKIKNDGDFTNAIIIAYEHGKIVGKQEERARRKRAV